MKNRALIQWFSLVPGHRITWGHVTSVAIAVGVARREADWLRNSMLATAWLLSEYGGGALDRWVPRAERGDGIRQIEKFLFVGQASSQHCCHDDSNRGKLEVPIQAEMRRTVDCQP
ncbi:hypothetical protein CORC01_14280 [Colletotrichum orchidophilum]|uniref:Uncharacterized protein n=1 Tax=Colletotrichum orchidophilum TaxID=1209926 RepID=A0A1G4AML1_9PEZI|nr:uncharacterized protein CORC01_14280 [Colletotrichum orchidophilum]OHE90420.1 hypothetical protein CORC01_14280 [Colletotrichum orchidophilum]